MVVQGQLIRTECKYFAIIAVYPKINAIALILLLNLDITKGKQGDKVQSMRGKEIAS